MKGNVMTDIFSGILDVAVAAGWIVLAVVVLRLLFYKASNAVKCAMWGIVALRLMLPVLFESSFAVVPSFSVQRIVEESRNTMAGDMDDMTSEPGDVYNIDKPDKQKNDIDKAGDTEDLVSHTEDPASHTEGAVSDTQRVYTENGSQTEISDSTMDTYNVARHDSEEHKHADTVDRSTTDNYSVNPDNSEKNTTLDGRAGNADTKNNTKDVSLKTENGKASDAGNTDTYNHNTLSVQNYADKTSAQRTSADKTPTDKTDIGFNNTDIRHIIEIMGYVWLTGMILLLSYGIFAGLRLHNRLKTAIRSKNEKDVYYSEFATSPFVFGVIDPLIYLGFGLSDERAANVIAHERTHIRRKDHIFKLVAYLMLTVYWFVPWVWLAFILYCKDMEMACDEAVIRTMDNKGRAEYSQTLFEFAKSHGNRLFCPVYFGESDIKKRIRNIAGYKKKPVWISITAVLVCVLVGGILFFTASGKQDADNGSLSAVNDDITGGIGTENHANDVNPDSDQTDLLQGNTEVISRPSDIERMAHVPAISVPGVLSCNLIDVLTADESLGKISAGDFREWSLGRPDTEKEPAHLESLYRLKNEEEKEYTVYLSGDGKDIVIIDGKEIRYLKDVNWDNGRMDCPTVEKMDVDRDGDDDFVVIIKGPRGTGVFVSELMIVETVTTQEALLRLIPGDNGSTDSQETELLKALIPSLTEEEYTLLKAKPTDEEKVSYVWKASNADLCDDLSSRLAVGYMPDELGYAFDDQIRGWVHVENGYNVNLLFEESGRFQTGVKSLLGEQISFGYGSTGLIMQVGIGIFDKTGDGPNGPLGEYVYDYSPNLTAEIEFSYENGFRLVNTDLYFDPGLQWSYEADIIHSDMIDKVLFDAFGDEYQVKTATYGFGDIDKDGLSDYAVVARDAFSDEYMGYVALYFNGNKIYEYYHPYLKLFPYEARYADFDQDGKKEIFFSMYTNANSEELQLYTVLKRTDDGWKELAIPQNPDPLLHNAFPIDVVRGDGNVFMICTNPIGLQNGESGGIISMVQYNIKEHYSRLLEEVQYAGEEYRQAYEALADGSAFENGMQKGGILGWGICEIKEQGGFLIAKHKIKGSDYKADYLGDLYVIFNYDIAGRVVVRDMRFIPNHGTEKDVYVTVGGSSEGVMRTFDGKLIVERAFGDTVLGNADNEKPESEQRVSEIQRRTVVRKTFADWYTDESSYDFSWEGLSDQTPGMEADYGSGGVLQAYLIAGKGHGAGLSTLLIVLRDSKDRKTITDYAVLPGDMPGYLWKTDPTQMDYDHNYAGKNISETDPAPMHEISGRELYIRQGSIYQGFFSTSFYGRVYVSNGEICLEPDPDHYITYMVHYNPCWDD